MRYRPHPLAEILDQCPGLKPLRRSIAHRQALLEQVRRSLPAPLDGHCVSAGLSGDRLVLFADSPVWGTRLRFLAPGLVSALGNAGTPVKDVRVRILAAADPPRKAPERRATLSSANAHLLLQVADGINDPALCQALKRLARRGG